jgi:transposase
MPTPPFLLTTAQMRRLSPHFPLPRGIPRVDDCRVLSGIIFVLKGGLRWRDAPPGYGPHKTLYNRFVRLSRMCVFDRIFAALATEGGPPERLMIDSTHLKAHRTAASLRKRGGGSLPRPHQGRAERQAPRRLRRPGAPHRAAAHQRPSQ